MQNVAQITKTISAPLVQNQPVLDVVTEQLQAGWIDQPLDELFDDLKARQEEDGQVWPAYAGACRSHEACELLHQDPFTYRAFSKPRGYAGDAVMMDYIYGLGEAIPAARAATPLGRAIFEYMGTRPSARGVRYRRQLIADLIDRTVARGGNRVLALAAGHLREVELSAAVQAGQVEEFVAFDQDEASLAVVARDYGHLGVRTVNGSVRAVLAGKANLGQFDFVYAAGLFDYLSAPVATALTRLMFQMVRPGGTLLIPNFLPGVGDRGYMESFMDWHLIYRDHADMQALASALPPDQVESCRVFDDNNEAIIYLLVRKADEQA
ncbi:MAG: class I SAM-dependent methyltransferase [Paludibaculum sp.]